MRWLSVPEAARTLGVSSAGLQRALTARVEAGRRTVHVARCGRAYMIASIDLPPSGDRRALAEHHARHDKISCSVPRAMGWFRACARSRGEEPARLVAFLLTTVREFGTMAGFSAHFSSPNLTTPSPDTPASETGRCPLLNHTHFVA